MFEFLVSDDLRDNPVSSGMMWNGDGRRRDRVDSGYQRSRNGYSRRIQLGVTSPSPPFKSLSGGVRDRIGRSRDLLRGQLSIASPTDSALHSTCTARPLPILSEGQPWTLKHPPPTSLIMSSSSMPYHQPRHCGLPAFFPTKVELVPCSCYGGAHRPAGPSLSPWPYS